MPESLKSFVNRCRCCLEKFFEDEKTSIITSFFSIQFKSFTSMNLDSSELLSSKVCEFCHSELLRFSVFKKDLIEKQQRLTELLKQHNEKRSAKAVSGNKTKSKTQDVDFSDQEDEEEENSVTYETSSDLDDFLIVKANDQPTILDKSPIATKLIAPAVITPTTEHTREQFTCDYCLKEFKAKQGLTRHVQSHIEVSVPWKCNVKGCEFAASSRIKLNMHKLRAHGIPLPTAKADNYPQKKKLVKTVNREFACFCGVAFGSLLSLRAHKNRLHGSRNKCKYGCKDVQYVNLGHFLRHVQSKHPEKLEDCLMQTESHFPRSIDMSGKPVILSCDICDFKTLKKSSLRSHCITHLPFSERERFECNKCHKTFTRATSMRVHLLTVHDKIRKYKCSKCATSFKQIGHLNDHITVKHGNKLEKHSSLETNRVSYKQVSNEQDKTSKTPLSTKKRLLKHQQSLSHEPERNGFNIFKCSDPDCHLAFKQRCNLIRHQKDKKHLSPEQISLLKFTCVCGSRFFTERGYSYHREKSNCVNKS